MLVVNSSRLVNPGNLSLRIMGPSKKDGFGSVFRRVLFSKPLVTWDPMILRVVGFLNPFRNKVDEFMFPPSKWDTPRSWSTSTTKNRHRPEVSPLLAGARVPSFGVSDSTSWVEGRERLNPTPYGTVNGYPADQLRLVVYPIIYGVSAPSRVVSRNSSINSMVW